jgi:hypothetical protein
MKNILFLLIVLFAYGCASIAPESNELKTTELRHETSESTLLTEAEFMDRVSQSADLIYDGLRVVNDAASRYVIDLNASGPGIGGNALRTKLLDEGYLKEWPVVPPFAFTDPVQGDFRYFRGYADVDVLDGVDDVLTVQELKTEVCQVFVRRYASPGFRETIHDFDASGRRYPTEISGQNITIYGVDWFSGERGLCDILWVMKYPDPIVKKPRFPRSQ